MHDRRILPAGRPLRVLQIDPNANTPPYDRALCGALADAGCDVTLLTSRFLYEQLDRPAAFTLDEHFFKLAGSRIAARLKLESRPAVRRALKAVEYPLDWLALLLRLVRQRPDIIHVQWSFEPRLDLLLWRFLRRFGAPLVYTAHNLVPHDAPPSAAARYGRLYRAADGLVVHSRRSATALREQWAVAAERIDVVQMGPHFEAVQPLDRDAARRGLGLPLDVELVLFAGLIEPYKGLGDLIAGFGELAARRPSARLAVAGKPNEPFTRYQQMLADHDVADRAILDLAFLPEARLAAYLCAADVVVLPYRATTASAMLLAARRFGRPVVVTAVGDLAEIVIDGQNGLVVPPNSPTQLGAAIERLLADPVLAARLGAAGQREAFGPQSWPVAAERTIGFYRRLLERA